MCSRHRSKSTYIVKKSASAGGRSLIIPHSSLTVLALPHSFLTPVSQQDVSHLPFHPPLSHFPTPGLFTALLKNFSCCSEPPLPPSTSLRAPPHPVTTYLMPHLFTRPPHLSHAPSSSHSELSVSESATPHPPPPPHRFHCRGHKHAPDVNQLHSI